MSLSFVQLNGYPVMVYEKGGVKYYWLAGCPHKRRPLSDGKVFDDKIECPFHHAVFSLITGEMVKEPQSKTPCVNCKLIRVVVEGGSVKFEGEPFIPELPKR